MQAIVIKQHDQNSGYTAFHIGVPKKNAGNDPNFYSGHWCDVTGNKDEFRLTKSPS